VDARRVVWGWMQRRVVWGMNAEEEEGFGLGGWIQKDGEITLSWIKGWWDGGINKGMKGRIDE
jgi:hypothetical protein